MAFPSTIDSFTINVDGVDYVLAADVNELQTAIVAIETALGIGTAIYADWTPEIRQGGSTIARTVTAAKYRLVGKMCHLVMNVTMTAAGAAGNAVNIQGWPSAINPYQMGSSPTVGLGVVVDTGTATYPALAFIPGGNQIQFYWLPTQNYVGVNPSFALANTDEINLDCVWRIA